MATGGALAPEVSSVYRSNHTVMHSLAIDYTASVIGWIYFAAWTLSFYPQVIINWRRKSVVGLSFDFVLFNVTGFIAYSCFNVGLYWIPSIKEEYFKDNEDGVSPVQINDVIFALHALAVSLFIALQCVIYERGHQKISTWSKVFLCGVVLYVIISSILTLTSHMTWLDFLYNFSYIKLVVTFLKYTPQAYFNFKRKSTVGWSIGNVLLDFIGGWLSILQMFLLAYNGDDWDSIFGNVTKFGLGVVTIIYDSIFLVQHYVLYRGKASYQGLKELDIEVTPPGHMLDKHAAGGAHTSLLKSYDSVQPAGVSETSRPRGLMTSL
ncbi:cystinosin-like [Physella acuta]|uniref:cystinosin-like n=1 Tax=Physella acuta TaxID=109671 RepID=UPI0027DAFBFD|nr:cystinosin-like [Physella acuta]